LLERASTNLKALRQPDKESWCWSRPTSWRLALFLSCLAMSFFWLVVLAILQDRDQYNWGSRALKLGGPGLVLCSLLLLLAWTAWSGSRMSTCLSLAGHEIRTWQQPRQDAAQQGPNRPPLSAHSPAGIEKRKVRVIHHSPETGYLFLGTSKSGHLARLTLESATPEGMTLPLQGLSLEEDISLWLLLQASIDGSQSQTD
jgi:hypothetical protein